MEQATCRRARIQNVSDSLTCRSGFWTRVPNSGKQDGYLSAFDAQPLSALVSRAHSGSGVQGPVSGVRCPGSGVRDPVSGIRTQSIRVNPCFRG
jgi:hypothetical protein